MVLQEHEGVPSDHLYRISPKQVVSWGWVRSRLEKVPAGQTVAPSSTEPGCPCQVVPAGGSSSISISFTPMVLGPHVLHKVECIGYALGFMSLDSKVSPPGLGRGHGRRLLGPATASDQAWARRWKGSFPGGGGACRTLPWGP